MYYPVDLVIGYRIIKIMSEAFVVCICVRVCFNTFEFNFSNTPKL